MLKGALIAAADALAVAAVATAVAGSAAMAAPRCENQANTYVTCANTLKAKPQTNTPDQHFNGVVSRFSQGQRTKNSYGQARPTLLLQRLANP
jgi:hypothetical protein